MRQATHRRLEGEKPASICVHAPGQLATKMIVFWGLLKFVLAHAEDGSDFTTASQTLLTFTSQRLPTRCLRSKQASAVASGALFATPPLNCHTAPSTCHGGCASLRVDGVRFVELLAAGRLAVSASAWGALAFV